MTRNTEHADLLARRREIVARMRLRQMSLRDIARALAKEKDKDGHPIFVNPKTGEPVDVAQIQRDLKHIRAEWHAARMATMDEHAARILAELGEIKRMAIGEKDARAWLAAVKQEAELLGANQPLKVQLSWRDEIGELIRTGRATFADVRAELGDDLAAQLFREAGVAVDAGGA